MTDSPALYPQIAHQQVGDPSAARRDGAGMAVALSSHRNTADGGSPACPKGASQKRQCRVAVLGKGYGHSLRTAPCLGDFGRL